MIGRVLVFAGGLAGGLGASQYPEFSQQYMQRLSGAVDELARFVVEFDEDAAGLGLSREEALVQLASGGEIGAARATTVSRTVTRHRRLSADLAELDGAGPFTRAYNAGRLTDGEIARAAWGDFRPALPLTFEGAIFAGGGLILGMGGMAVLWSLVMLPFRRRDGSESEA